MQQRVVNEVFRFLDRMIAGEERRRADGDDLLRHQVFGDEALIGSDHPLEMRAGEDGDDAPRPYVRIRGDLWARFARPAYYRLINEESWEKDGSLYISSAGLDYELGAVT